MRKKGNMCLTRVYVNLFIDVILQQNGKQEFF